MTGFNDIVPFYQVLEQIWSVMPEIIRYCIIACISLFMVMSVFKLFIK